MSGSEPDVGGRAAGSYCPTCKAVFRGGFQRCPNDGSRLASGDVDPLVGTVLAERYQIEAVIGDGGIGRVYAARHVRMSRRFAIKVPFGELGYDRKARARFANEAEAASRLSHPNVIGVVDVGETADGLFYMAMDLAEGQSLGDALAAGPLPAAQALPLLVQLADGLGHAHDRGLVHRDLKPDNILLSAAADGTPLVRIVDFGLAIVDATDGPRARLTTEGVVLGTPHYMAPEQATDEPLDHRTDLFAVGLILYEMLAGVHPFDGTPMDVARQNLSRALPPIRERAGLEVDPLLEALIGWLTRKLPAERPDHAQQVAAVARHLIAGERDAARALLPAAPASAVDAVDAVDAVAPVDAVDAHAAVAGARPPPPVAPAWSPPPTAEPHTPTARVAPTRRRWALVALLVVALGGTLAGVALVGDGGDGARAVAMAADAAPIVAERAVDAGGADDARAMIDEPIDAAAAAPVDAGVRSRPVDAGVRPRRVDAAVARAPADAAVPRPARVDAAVPETPAPSLKGRYAQVGRALDAAIARHGQDATAALRRRYAAIPPYLEAARKPDLRAQAEAQLEALRKDLAALK